jgi:hypothetical protein
MKANCGKNIVVNDQKMRQGTSGFYQIVPNFTPTWVIIRIRPQHRHCLSSLIGHLRLPEDGNHLPKHVGVRFETH